MTRRSSARPINSARWKLPSIFAIAGPLFFVVAASLPQRHGIDKGSVEPPHDRPGERGPDPGADSGMAQGAAGPFVAGEHRIVGPDRLVEHVGLAVTAADQGHGLPCAVALEP